MERVSRQFSKKVHTPAKGAYVIQWAYSGRNLRAKVVFAAPFGPAMLYRLGAVASDLLVKSNLRRRAIERVF